MRPVGQAVKTRPFHGCNMGSIPVRVTKAPASQEAGAFLYVQPLGGQKPGDPYGNCCAGDRRLRRKQGAGAGAAVAEDKPPTGAPSDAYPQLDKARVRRLCQGRAAVAFYWPLYAAWLFRNQRCALVFASRCAGLRVIAAQAKSSCGTFLERGRFRVRAEPERCGQGTCFSGSRCFSLCVALGRAETR